MTTRVRLVVASSAIASLVPLVAYAALFQRLFFFHDDWELLDGAARLGLGRWLGQPFLGEGIIPLFKLLWLGAVHLTGGEYFGLIVLLWITHAAICLLFGCLLARFGFPLSAIAFAVLIFGLAWTNIETLGWSMQWNSQLAIIFFLAAWHFLLDESELGAAAGCLCILASGLCSSRGIISGLVLAIFVLAHKKGVHRVRRALLCLAPTVFLALMMWLTVPHHELAPVAALRYGGEYLLLNPIFALLPFPHSRVGIFALAFCGAVKTALYVWAVWKAGRSLRPLLWSLIALDLVVAASLGYSRWQTGVATAASSRYQYIPLLCFGALAGTLIARLRPTPRFALILICAGGAAFPWERHAEQWSTWRGTDIRMAILRKDPAEHFDPSSLTVGRARELIRLYNLR